MKQSGAMVVVGAQWGDEGKGKIVDHYAQAADVVVRYQGGANAGHTLVVGGRKTVLHLVPSGILHPGKVCAIGPGCVVDPDALLDEIDTLLAAGVDVTPARLLVSDRAHLVLPVHRRLDQAREHAAGEGRIGTTGRGIGPAYEDAVARRGVRFVDLADEAALRERVEKLLRERNILLQAFGAPPFMVDEIVAPLRAAWQRIGPFVADVGLLLERRAAAGESLLFEGAQGTLLDVQHGTYPYVTSSSTVAGGACTGAGVGPRRIGEVVGIVKAYCTRVGEGPFPTELTGDLGERLRSVGQEFGATTGRPRRCGWLDAVALRYAARINGLTALALTKLDVLSGVESLQICVGYELDGRTLDEMPVDVVALERVRPVYETVPGFAEDVTRARRFAALPEAARRYVERIEALCGVPVRLVSVGAGRDAVIERAAG